MTQRNCCHIDQETNAECDKPAEWEIWFSPFHPHSDQTDSCTEHFGDMLSDAPEHSIFHIEPEHVSNCELCGAPLVWCTCLEK